MDLPRSELFGTRLREWILWSLWAFLLASIPMTSFPLVAKLTRGSTASPLAGLPLVLLVVFWLIPYLLKRGNFPVISIPLFLFAGIAIFSSVLVPFHKIFPIFEQSVVFRTVRGLATLGIGICFYLVGWYFTQTEQAMRKSLRWLYLGALLLLVWASIQAYIISNYEDIPEKVQYFHRLFSIRDIPKNRVVGFAYEPSWVGDLLVILYLPLWLSSVIRSYSVFTSQPKRFSIEFGLLLWGMIVLFLSHSRIGLLSAMASIGILGIYFSWVLIGRWAEIIQTRWIDTKRTLSRFGVVMFRLILWLMIFGILFTAGLGIVKLSSQSDQRIARVFETDYLGLLKGGPTAFYGLSESLQYAERVMWWVMGYRVFSLYPLFGSGLGITGFFFRETVPAYAYHLPEMVRAFRGQLYFPNPANLWIRLLAETGIVGFIVFFSWLLILGYGALELARRVGGWRGMIGLAGLLALIAQIFEGFSLGTFSLPQLWIMLGILTAAISANSATEDR